MITQKDMHNIIVKYGGLNMKVIINNNVYGMTRKQLNSVLVVASKQIPFGIYAVEKDGICELRKDKFDSLGKLKKAVSDFEKKGFKVSFNGK